MSRAHYKARKCYKNVVAYLPSSRFPGGVNDRLTRAKFGRKEVEFVCNPLSPGPNALLL